jgi:hypothetical protein
MSGSAPVTSREALRISSDAARIKSRRLATDCGFPAVSRDIRRISCDEELISHDGWRVSQDTWRISRDIWRISRDIRRISRDTWRVIASSPEHLA